LDTWLVVEAPLARAYDRLTGVGMQTRRFKRPILVWVIVLFFSVPALFYLVTHALVAGGIISPPATMSTHFTGADPVSLAISLGEAVLLVVAMSTLLVMSKLALPFCAAYFAIDLLHSLSGKYLLEPTTSIDLVIAVVIGIAAVGYVWHLKRSGQLH
jgi:hypothetical protein